MTGPAGVKVMGPTAIGVTVGAGVGAGVGVGVGVGVVVLLLLPPLLVAPLLVPGIGSVAPCLAWMDCWAMKLHARVTATNATMFDLSFIIILNECFALIFVTRCSVPCTSDSRAASFSKDGAISLKLVETIDFKG